MRFRFWKAVSLAFLSILVTTTVAGAGTASTTLKGRVVGPDGAVIEGAQIKLANSVTGRVAETTTDAR